MIVLCFACSFVFLLLFFLIPRTPLVSGVSSMQGHITTDSSPSFVIEAGYDMFNPNPYAVAVSKIDTTVTVSTTPSNSSEQIYTISGAGVWPPGQSSVNIRSSSWGTVPVWYYFNGTDSSKRTAIRENIEQCCSSFSTVVTDGTMDVQSWLRLYEMPVKKIVSDVYCQCG